MSEHAAAQGQQPKPLLGLLQWPCTTVSAANTWGSWQWLEQNSCRPHRAMKLRLKCGPARSLAAGEAYTAHSLPCRHVPPSECWRAPCTKCCALSHVSVTRTANGNNVQQMRHGRCRCSETFSGGKQRYAVPFGAEQAPDPLVPKQEITLRAIATDFSPCLSCHLYQDRGVEIRRTLASHAPARRSCCRTFAVVCSSCWSTLSGSAGCATTVGTAGGGAVCLRCCHRRGDKTHRSGQALLGHRLEYLAGRGCCRRSAGVRVV